jgi:hypothetical protein
VTFPKPPEPMPDAARLLSSVADALNQCERNGIAVEADHGGILSRYGYVLPAGDARLGSRWAVRTRMDAGLMASGGEES